MGKRGGKSARCSALRDRLTARMSSGFSKVKPSLGSEYAYLVAKAADGDIHRCQPDVEWVHSTGVTSQHIARCMVTAIMDERNADDQAAAAVGECVEANLASKVNASRALDKPSRSGVKAVAHSASKSATQRGTDGSRPEVNASSKDNQIATHFLRLLDGLPGTRRLVTGYELQWEAAVARSLDDLRSEFEIINVFDRFNKLCTMGQTLFLRELKAKATRVLAHKKKLKKK